jgi:hypothetical protein
LVSGIGKSEFGCSPVKSSEFGWRQEIAASLQPGRNLSTLSRSKPCPLIAKLQTRDRERNFVRFVPIADITVSLNSSSQSAPAPAFVAVDDELDVSGRAGTSRPGIAKDCRLNRVDCLGPNRKSSVASGRAFSIRLISRAESLCSRFVIWGTCSSCLPAQALCPRAGTSS